MKEVFIIAISVSSSQTDGTNKAYLNKKENVSFSKNRFTTTIGEAETFETYGNAHEEIMSKIDINYSYLKELGNANGVENVKPFFSIEKHYVSERTLTSNK